MGLFSKKPKENPTNFRVVLVRNIFIIAGIISVGLGIYFFTSIEKYTERTVGTVIDVKKELNPQHRGFLYVYYPVLSYQAQGITVTKKRKKPYFVASRTG
jgi:hypothetical protein